MVSQHLAFIWFEDASIFQCCEGCIEAWRLQVGVAPAIDQLVALYRKLNFADTAASKFDVIFQVLTYQLALNQCFHFPYSFKRAKIQILSVHKGS